jgi:hypothetical protein
MPDVVFAAGRFVFHALCALRDHYIERVNEMPHSNTRRHPCNDCMEPLS